MQYEFPPPSGRRSPVTHWFQDPDRPRYPVPSHTRGRASDPATVPDHASDDVSPETDEAPVAAESSHAPPNSTPAAPQNASSVEPVNLFEARGLTAGRAGLFQQAADTLGVRCADELDKWMSDFTVTAEAVEQICLLDLGDKSSRHIIVLECDDGVARGLIAIDLDLALGLATLLLGGRPGDYVDARPLTALEAGVLEQLISPFTELIADAYRLNPVAIEGHVSDTFLLPDLVKEPALEIPIKIEGAELEGRFSFGLYMSTLQRFSESVDRRLAGTTGGRRYRQNSVTQRAVQPIPLDLAVGFDPMPVSARDLAGLQAGDVLRTHHPVTRDLIARVGESTLFMVKAGQLGKRLVAEVVGPAVSNGPGGQVSNRTTTQLTGQGRS